MATFFTRLEGSGANVAGATTDEYATCAFRVQPPTDIKTGTLFTVQQETGVRITQLAVGAKSSIYDCLVVDTSRGDRSATNEMRMKDAAFKIATIAAFTDSESFFIEQTKG